MGRFDHVLRGWEVRVRGKRRPERGKEGGELRKGTGSRGSEPAYMWDLSIDSYDKFPQAISFSRRNQLEILRRQEKRSSRVINGKAEEGVSVRPLSFSLCRRTNQDS